MAFVFEIPSLLEICGKFACPPEVQSVAAENLAPSVFINTLQQGKKSLEAVHSLARMMPDEKSVEWAVGSAKMGGAVAGLSDEEMKALDAALDWAENPGTEAQATAFNAAQGLSPSSPSYWAANAAAFAQPATELAAMAGDASSHFAAGAVLLAAGQAATGASAGIPQTAMEVPIPQGAVAQAMGEAAVPEVAAMTPKQLEETAKLLEPFIKKGLEIAETVPGWS
ncbi:MAG: hypothetical protein BM485_04135 [Desulfobulbaceae bacterium DB1]|nr:MAG: hypothetical protein BM485_04135 [Desulfobulbaceae bacterium DB1]